MVFFLLFLVAGIGLTNIIVDSSLFAPVRDLLKKILPAKAFKVFECYQCAGMWCGMLVGAWLIDHHPFTIVCCGFAISFLASLSAHFFNYLEAKSIVEIDLENE